jgi:hypothetical protein
VVVLQYNKINLSEKAPRAKARAFFLLLLIIIACTIKASKVIRCGGLSVRPERLALGLIYLAT